MLWLGNVGRGPKTIARTIGMRGSCGGAEPLPVAMKEVPTVAAKKSPRHAEVFDVLLRLLDDARLTDSHGRTVDSATPS